MAGKVRLFSVAALVPVLKPYHVEATSRLNLSKRLASALDVPQIELLSIADALWKGSPVVTSNGYLFLPGRFDVISYQVVS